MKRIYTSYLNKKVNWKEHNITPVRVCRWVFKNQLPCDLCVDLLYPPIELIRANQAGIISWEEYTAIYNNEVLSKVNAQDIVDFLPDNSVLMCHEKQHETCHRTLIGQWIESNTNIVIQEWMSSYDIKLMNQRNNVDSLVKF